MPGTDPALAAGLTKRYFRELFEKIERLDRFLGGRLAGANSSKKQWGKFVKDIGQHYPSMLCTYLGGTPKREYLCLETIMIGNWNPNFFDLNAALKTGWEEKSLVVTKEVFPYRARSLHKDRPDYDENQIAYVVSQHAISRLIERTLSFDQNMDLLGEQIRGEMQYIGLWSSIYQELFCLAYVDDSDLNFIIPSEHGIFLAKYSRNTICVRTYYKKEMMSQEQLEIRDALMGVSDDFKSSPLRFFLQIYALELEPDVLKAAILGLILQQLRNHIEVIVREITRKTPSDHAEVAFLKNISSVANQTPLTLDQSDDLYRAFEELGLDLFLIEIRKHAKHNLNLKNR